MGWRGDGTLWSSTTAIATQRLTGLPGFGAGDVLMFVLDPATGGLWIGKNGIWRDDPLSEAPTWTTSRSPAFHPQIQGRNPGDGGTLRSLPAQFSYPVPPGVAPLGFEDPDLRVFEVGIWIDRGALRDLTVANVEAWAERGGAARLTASRADLFLEQGGTPHLTLAIADLFIELDSP
jgi:hypothetical protein